MDRDPVNAAPRETRAAAAEENCGLGASFIERASLRAAW
jgi:hypothetical protein